MKTLRHQADLHDGSTKVSMIFPESTGIELDFLHPPQFSQSAPWYIHLIWLYDDQWLLIQSHLVYLEPLLSLQVHF